MRDLPKISTNINFSLYIGDKIYAPPSNKLFHAEQEFQKFIKVAIALCTKLKDQNTNKSKLIYRLCANPVYNISTIII